MQNIPLSLLADVGGTHSRCAVVLGDVARHVIVYDNADYTSLESLLRNYVRTHLTPAIGTVDEVILGVAGRVNGNQVQLLNRDWSFSAASVSQALGARHTRLVNDFEALAYALPVFADKDVHKIGGRNPSPFATKAVLGPGTGLGVSGVVWTGERWLALPGEGGHVTLAASNEQEERLCRYLRDRFGHASAERALCGSGLSHIHECFTNQVVEAPQLSAMAQAGEPRAKETFELFFGLLASVAGDLALTLGAEGGVYLAGGIINKNEVLLNQSEFRQRFENKGRYSDYVTGIPVLRIINPTPALAGLSYLRHHNDIDEVAGHGSC